MKRIISLGLFGLIVGLHLGCGRPKAPDHTEKGTDAPVAPAVANSETAEESLKALSGEWQLASVQNLPPGVDEAFIKKVTARVDGKVLTLSSGIGIGYFKQAEVRLDPTKTPKPFDLVALDETGKPQTVKIFSAGGKEQERPVEVVQGIYRLSGDQLTVALTDRSGYRPTELKPSVMENTGEFVTVNRRGTTYVTVLELKRVK